MVKSKGDVLFNILVYVIIFTVGLICLIPVLFVISASVTPYSELLKNGGFVLIPRKFTNVAYVEMLADGALSHAMWVTVKLTVIATALNLVVTLMLAYPLSRHSMPLSGAMMKIVMFCMLFDAGIVPTYLIVRKTGLINTLWAMIVPTLVSAYNLVIMKAFFEGLPEELFEAARIDGCGRFRQIWYITLPNLGRIFVVLLITKVGNILDGGFNQVYVFMNDRVRASAEIIDTWVYTQGLGKAQYSLTTAVGLMKSVLSCGLVLGTNALARKWDSSLW